MTGTECETSATNTLSERAIVLVRGMFILCGLQSVHESTHRRQVTRRLGEQLPGNYRPTCGSPVTIRRLTNSDLSQLQQSAAQLCGADGRPGGRALSQVLRVARTSHVVDSQVGQLC